MSNITNTTLPVSRRNRQARRQNRSTTARISGYALVLQNHRCRLANIVLIYQNQLCIYPLQVEATLTYLLEVRRVVDVTRVYLERLAPAETQRIRPYACIAKLTSLDYLLTELLLTVAMFAEVCQTISPMRVQMHIEIRAALPALLVCYDDLLAQLSALSNKARQEITAIHEQGGQE